MNDVNLSYSTADKTKESKYTKDRHHNLPAVHQDHVPKHQLLLVPELFQHEILP